MDSSELRRIAPIIGGREPRFQRLGVNVLFGALLLVAGSLAGEYFAIHQKLDLDLSFWFGHQGYEYVDLGRVWQIALFVGLALWLVLMLRALWPAIQRRDGLWYARSADFLQTPWIETLRWMRVVGDTVFAVGAAAFAWFMLGLITGWSYDTGTARLPKAGATPVPFAR
jgi:nitric oxide reductase large subunit